MDPNDSDFLKQLFRENNDLRVKVSTAQREIFNKTLQCDHLEEELRNAWTKLEEAKTTKVHPKAEATRADSHTPAKREMTSSTGPKPTSKDLDEALFAIDKLNTEIQQLKSELGKSRHECKEEASRADATAKENDELLEEVLKLRDFKEETILKESEAAKEAVVKEIVPDDIKVLRENLEFSEKRRNMLKSQLISICEESNRIQNDQQNQLQGAQAVIDAVRSEYEEFIQVTRHEYDSYKTQYLQDYEQLRNNYEMTKLRLFEEKKKMGQEYQTLLFSMQMQFEDYRKTTEFLFSAELVKLEDELTSQAQRFEQEIMYVVQAKDKFYSDLMVAKDAKIMSLIEGSDLQSMMQKHELDLEGLRKEHAKEIERVKSDQETESKNIIALLQRQNVSLESKCDKVQSHLKVLEGRMKELMTTIDTKNKTISEKEEFIIKTEVESKAKFLEMNTKLNSLSQEKEHLRHKVIRLNLDARGEGENSLQNMIKRISRETSDLHSEFEELGVKYDGVLSENQNLIKRLKDREKLVEFLEVEVKRRSEEFKDMTRTFEEFLAGRARQCRKEQTKRLAKLGMLARRNVYKLASSNEESVQASEKKSSSFATNLGARKVVKAHIPDRDERISAPDANNAIFGQVELERGNAYLKRFKNLSKAFATGDFRIISHGEAANADRNIPGPWQKTALYSKLSDATAVTQLYKEIPRASALPSDNLSKPTIYTSNDMIENPQKTATDKEIKLYNSKAKQFYKPKKKSPEILTPAVPKDKEALHIGGTGVNI